MSTRTLRLARIGAGVVVIAGTIATVGAAPIARGILSITPGAVLVSLLLTAIATAAAAWRWKAVSQRLGVPLGWGSAIAAYYRSQFLNSVLPGGVVGDVHRAYRQGRESDNLPTALRAVAVERVVGQVVQVPLAVIVLLATGAIAALSALEWVGLGLLTVLLLAVAIGLATTSGRRVLRHEAMVLRRVFASPRAVFEVLAASIIVVAAHTATFVVACLIVGANAGPSELLALATVALLAAAIPFGIGGWGPREAASASAFALVGLTAGVGLAASAAFGVLTLISVLPGLIVLIVGRATPRSSVRITTLKESA
jgi:uncharacterized membrane protein YbhN (UPF0104 family)